MRIPYLQIAEKFIATEAPMVAAMTGLDLDSTIGKGVRLFAFVIDKTSSAEKPPDGVLMFPEAIAVIEGIMGWTGAPGRLAEALITAGTIERLEVGIRVRGCDRYRATWEKNRRRPKPAGRNRTGTGPEPDRLSTGTAPKPERETETETEEACDRTPPRSASQHAAPAVETDRASSEVAAAWGAEAWEAYTAAFPQSAQQPPGTATLFGWYSGAVRVLKTQGRPVSDLQAAWRGFLADEFWRAKRQPCPWSAWLTRWTEFLPGQSAPQTAGNGRPILRPVMEPAHG